MHGPALRLALALVAAAAAAAGCGAPDVPRARDQQLPPPIHDPSTGASVGGVAGDERVRAAPPAAAPVAA
ncbi:MAG: hypothetical protein NDJ75_07800, partial [Thermoanaerobaculia bacterium]|nr:hypothetical protein [Thermoanaerobaculia bacterium]